jgi:hypothetical protein
MVSAKECWKQYAPHLRNPGHRHVCYISRLSVERDCVLYQLSNEIGPSKPLQHHLGDALLTMVLMLLADVQDEIQRRRPYSYATILNRPNPLSIRLRLLAPTTL